MQLLNLSLFIRWAQVLGGGGFLGNIGGFLGDIGLVWVIAIHPLLLLGGFTGPSEFVSRSKLHTLKNGDHTGYCTQQFSRGFLELYGSKYAI